MPPPCRGRCCLSVQSMTALHMHAPVRPLSHLWAQHMTLRTLCCGVLCCSLLCRDLLLAAPQAAHQHYGRPAAQHAADAASRRSRGCSHAAVCRCFSCRQPGSFLARAVVSAAAGCRRDDAAVHAGVYARAIVSCTAVSDGSCRCCYTRCVRVIMTSAVESRNQIIFIHLSFHSPPMRCVCCCCCCCCCKPMICLQVRTAFVAGLLLCIALVPINQLIASRIQVSSERICAQNSSPQNSTQSIHMHMHVHSRC